MCPEKTQIVALSPIVCRTAAASSAAATKKHNDANVLCLGERIVGTGVAEAIVDAWTEATFEGGRHKERIDKIMNFEKNNLST